jgi:Domain of unknown function (DUF4389)
VGVYLALMDDRYPSTDEQQAVAASLRLPGRPPGAEALAAARQVVPRDPALRRAVFLDIAAVVVAIGAWFAILFSGRYPRGIFDYVAGVIRWHNRVVGCAFILVTDQYPPFRLRP